MMARARSAGAVPGGGWIACAVSACAVLAACEGADPSLPSDCDEDASLPGCARGPACGPGPKGEECLDRTYFRAAVVPLLEKHCAVCHVPGGLAWGSTGLELTGEGAWDSLVNTASNEMAVTRTPMLRVKPGQPESSYLYIKISQSVPPYGSRMPLADYTLTGAEIGAFRTWIKGRPHD